MFSTTELDDDHGAIYMFHYVQTEEFSRLIVATQYVLLSL